MVKGKRPEDMKCNTCQAQFVYGKADKWLDNGGPVLCQKHK